MDFDDFSEDYSWRVNEALSKLPAAPLRKLSESLMRVWRSGSQVFLFGNGGSAGNASHIANDLFYGTAGRNGKGLRAHALAANTALLTCLANDEGYERIFSKQLSVLAVPGDLAIALSGSGASANVIQALQHCRHGGIETAAILGFDGGEAKAIANIAIHVPVDDMQISEDLQLIVGHMMMRWLCAHGPRFYGDQS